MKPREFFIDPPSDEISDEISDDILMKPWVKNHGVIHVIEKSAYDKLEAELKDAKTVLEMSKDRLTILRERDTFEAKLKIAVEALTICAVEECWNHYSIAKQALKKITETDQKVGLKSPPKSSLA